jgi:ssDNA-binding Zn-finger/Zn-ribbon topoisomerase 1
MLVECPACRGRKKVMKIGMSEGDCNQCRGTGKVSPVERDALLVAHKKHSSDTVATIEPVKTEIKAKDSKNDNKLEKRSS